MLKKAGIINAPLLSGLAELGHTDMCILSDVGFPIPKEVPRIDLSLVPGMPSLLEVLEAVIAEMDVEEALVSAEIAEANPKMLKALEELLQRTEGIELKHVSHSEFKERSHGAKFIARTGENTPYSNIMLIAGAKTNIIVD